jgi:hypothetical protein
MDSHISNKLELKASKERNESESLHAVIRPLRLVFSDEDEVRSFVCVCVRARARVSILKRALSQEIKCDKENGSSQSRISKFCA